MHDERGIYIGFIYLLPCQDRAFLVKPRISVEANDIDLIFFIHKAGFIALNKLARSSQIAQCE